MDLLVFRSTPRTIGHTARQSSQAQLRWSVDFLIRQTCKSSADIFRVILEIRPDPRRNQFITYGVGGPEHLSYKMCSRKRKIYILGYIFRARFKLKHIISRTNSMNKLYLFRINDG